MLDYVVQDDTGGSELGAHGAGMFELRERM